MTSNPAPSPSWSPSRVDRWVLDHRGPKAPVAASRAYAVASELEPDPSGHPVPTAAIFLTNRECPYRCLMCDLWTHTLDSPVSPGDIPRQIGSALASLPPVRQLKLYNAGSFFDPLAIPPTDDEPIARIVEGVDRVIVEAHPGFLRGRAGARALRFRDLLTPRLEVAIGLETAHDGVLARLNKRMTVADFIAGAAFLRQHHIDLRVFILLKPPFQSEADGVEWACRSIDLAIDCGAIACSIIPTRGGNGAMEALGAPYVPPRLASLETVVEHGLRRARARVFADTWDLERLFACDCSAERAARLRRMNLEQRILDPYSAPAMDVDLAIIGSGFGGSLLAMVARKLGRRVALIERGRHPRFAIGESASPLAGVILEQLADRYELPRVRPLSAYGTWRRAYPEISCGLKRGFTYFKHETGAPFHRTAARDNELLVAASPFDEVSDTHWYRAEVDHFLVREAQALGVAYLDGTVLDGIDWRDAGPVLTGTREGASLRIRARALVDATGPRGFLSRALAVDDRGFDRYPATQALFSHFIGVPRCADLPDFAGARTNDSPGATRTGAADGDVEPYPVDAAALHHVFDGGWMWVLRFENGITSAGCAVEPWLAAELRLSDGAAAWGRFIDRFPSIRAQFAGAEPVREFTWMPAVSYRAASAAGDRWAMLPSAAAFVDPLFSSGIPMTLVGIERLGRLLENGWPGGRSSAADIETYGQTTLAEADHTARFVAGCYAAFPRFDEFCAYSMLYFAAASFSEMSRRLGRTPPGLLFAADPPFVDAVRRLSPAAARTPALADHVSRAIARINIAGLSDVEKRNWYAANMADAIRGAEKLGASEAEVIAALGAAITSRD